MDLEQCFRRAYKDIESLLSMELRTSYNSDVVSVWSFNKLVHNRGPGQSSHSGQGGRGRPRQTKTTIELSLAYDDLYQLAASGCLLSFGKVCLEMAL